MFIDEQSTIELKPDSLSLRTSSGGAEEREHVLVYVEYLPVRDAVRNAVDAICREYRDELFPDICGHCGECCRGRDVFVTSMEIRRISHFLSIYHEEDFRTAFIEPSSSWNSQDGHLRKRGDHCIFLEQDAAERNQCAIYPVRPHGCETLQSTSGLCRKDPGELIVHMEKMVIQGAVLTMFRDTGVILKVEQATPDVQEAVEALKEILLRVEDEPVDELLRDIRQTDDKVNMLRMIFFEEGMTGEFFLRFQEISDAMVKIQKSAPAITPELALLCAKAARMVAFIEEEKAKTAPQSLPPGQAEKISLYQDSFTITLEDREPLLCLSASYRDHPAVLRGVRKIVSLLVNSDDPLVRESLWNVESQCFLCGECCRCYAVEINPSDIGRIAVHLGMAEQAFREEYLLPGIYSWNSRNAILAKAGREGAASAAPMPDDHVYHGMRLREPEKVTERTSQDCIFLQKQPDGLYCCRIYEARPHICRKYSTYNRPCQQVSLLTRPDTHSHNIVAITIRNEILYLTTRHTIRWNQTPVVIYLRENRQLQEVYHALKSEVLGSMEDRGQETEGMKA